MQYLFSLIALVLYIYAPGDYNFLYSLACVCVFVLESGWSVIKSWKREKIGFNIIFSVSFFATCFLFPVAIYGLDSSFSLFNLGYNSKVITKATALALFAYSMYIVGYMKKIKCNDKKIGTLSFTNQDVSSVFFLALITFILFIATGGLTYYNNIYLERNIQQNYLFEIVNVFFYCIVLLLCISLYYSTNKRNNTRVIVLSALIIVIITSTGSRTTPLAMLLVLLYIFQEKYKVSTRTLILLSVFAVVSLAVVGMIRTSGVSVENVESVDMKSSSIGYLSVFEDLVVVNRDLYDAYDYVDTHSITYGISFLAPILAVVPFLQGFLFSSLGIPVHLTNSASFFTYNLLGDNAGLGVGSNIVADVYLATGFWGVVILFYFLGYIISKSQAMMKHGSVSWSLVYLIMLSDAVFICRGLYFEKLKDIVWAIIILYIFNHFHIKQVLNENPRPVTIE